ncbi:hypothetical protein PIECOFPK_01545 [Mycovorax composti]|uniref:BACON domain-containing protein n=1 Tax=Mycovorax composti TaxID=2962693 RepID=A0ABZ2EKA1_9BACT
MLRNYILKNRFALLFIIFFISFISCKKDELPPKPEPSPFSATLENNTAAFPANGGTVNIVINAGTNGWCVINKIYGSGDYKLPVTILPNNTGMSRSITVTINPTFNLPPESITITQNAN